VKLKAPAGATEADALTAMQLNQETLDWALAAVPKEVADRYRTAGLQLEFLDDKECGAGPEWSWSSLEIKL